MRAEAVCSRMFKLFLCSCVVEVVFFTLVSDCSKVKNDYVFKTSCFFVFETLHIFVMLISSEKSSRKTLKSRTRVKLASVNANNYLTIVRGLANKISNDYSWTCNHFWRSTDQVLVEFLQQTHVVFCESSHIFVKLIPNLKSKIGRIL